MNYDTPTTRSGVLGVDVLSRGNVLYLHEPITTSESDEPECFYTGSTEMETHDELSTLIRTIATKDVESANIAALLQPENAVRRALDVYDVYISDTSLSPEEAVAEYLFAFTEAVIDPARTDVAPHDVEAIFSGFSALLEAYDVDARVQA